MSTQVKLRKSSTSLSDENSGKQHYIKFLSQKTFWCLDSLRCFSILAVIWHHSGGDTYSPNSLMFAGHHGVSLFFVISGFLITSLLIREKRSSGTICLKKFYIRRALRIFPLYYAVLLLYCVLVFLLEKGSTAGQNFFNNVIYFATYTSNYFVALGGDRVIFYFAWSLAVEEQFYLLWPTIEKWLDEYAATLAVCFLLLCIYLSNSQLLSGTNSVLLFLIKHLSIPICLGVLLAHALHKPTSFRSLWFICRLPGMVWFALFLPIALLINPHIPVEFFYLSLAFLLSVLLLNEDHPIRNFLELSVFIKIGTVSYGLYLFHMLSLNLVRKLIPHISEFNSVAEYQITCFLLATLIGYFIASLSYQYFEGYFLKLKQKWNTKHTVANNHCDQPERKERSTPMSSLNVKRF